MSTPKSVLEMAKKQGAKMVDIKFVDTFGTWQHFSLPISELEEDSVSDGLGLDGSSIRGWKSIEASDMLLIVDPGNVLVNYWAVADGSEKGKRIESGKGMPDAKTGWNGSVAPGNEAAAAGYVRIPIDAKIFTPDPGPDAKTSQRDHWNNSDYKTSDKAKRFIDTITQPESYWWAGGE